MPVKGEGDSRDGSQVGGEEQRLASMLKRLVLNLRKLGQDASFKKRTQQKMRGENGVVHPGKGLGGTNENSGGGGGKSAHPRTEEGGATKKGGEQRTHEKPRAFRFARVVCYCMKWVTMAKEEGSGTCRKKRRKR